MNEEYKAGTKEAYDAEERRRKAGMAKPMSSAPMRYSEDGAVDWGNMWDSFCVLASAGGPAHRATMLTPEQSIDPDSEAYKNVQSEIIRGIYLVSGLQAKPASAGWIAVECPMEGMAAWVSEQGVLENVMIQQHDSAFWVPCGQNWTVNGEVKNVITVVAKVTHYFADHISSDMKTTLIVEEGLSKVGALIKGLFGGRKHAIQ